MNKILKEKGFTILNSEKTDFSILIYAAGKQKVSVGHKSDIWYHSRWQPCGYSSVSSLDEGSLVIDIVDNYHELTWWGVVPGFLKSKTTFNEVNRIELNKNLSLILEDFPPD